uniref:Uncharacterized protein n=1 Tax=uncultured marine virus TaxID=186617 RepID=A0A0F7L5E8_9VIRU|nr:hypothetical protein [uncultured marine virus]
MATPAHRSPRSARAPSTSAAHRAGRSRGRTARGRSLTLGLPLSVRRYEKHLTDNHLAGVEVRGRGVTEVGAGRGEQGLNREAVTDEGRVDAYQPSEGVAGECASRREQAVRVAAGPDLYRHRGDGPGVREEGLDVNLSTSEEGSIRGQRETRNGLCGRRVNQVGVGDGRGPQLDVVPEGTLYDTGHDGSGKEVRPARSAGP